jgi:putative aldouronate transport system substrate-binding protein
MKRLTRREMLRLLGYGAAGAVLTACTQSTPAQTEPPANEPKADEATQPTTTTQATATPKPTTAPPATEPIVVTLIESWFGVPQFQDIVDPVNRALSQMMQDEGLNIEIRSMILDDHETKYPLLYTSGADFTCAFDAPWHRMPSLRDQGALLPLDDLFAEHAPNVLAGVTPKIWEFNQYNGVNYGIPVGFYYNEVTAITIRQDLLEKYGLEPPSPDEGWPGWKPFLEAVRDNEPDMIPLATRAYKGDCMADWNQWQQVRHHPGGNETAGFILPDWRAGQQWTAYEDVETFEPAVRLLHEFWEEGLIPEVPISSDTSVSPGNDYFLPGKAAAVVSNGMGALSGQMTKQIQEFVPGAKVWSYDTQGYTTGKRKGIGALKQWNFIVFNASASENKQIAGAQFWNWLYGGAEQQDIWFFGIEGENWNKEEPFRYVDPQGVDLARNYRKEWYISGLQGKYRRLPADAPQAWLDHLEFLAAEKNWDFTAYEKFDLDTKPIETEMATVSAAYDEAAYGWRTGAMPVADAISRFTTMMEGAGRRELMDKCQQQLDDWIAANKDYIDTFKS